MAASRYNLVIARKYKDRDGNEKTAFTNVGVVFPFRDKDGFTIRAHAIPAPEDGEYTFLAFPPQDRDDRGGGGGYGGGSGRSERREERPRDDKPLNRDLDDEIPF